MDSDENEKAKKAASRASARRLRSLTEDDSKVLGKYERRREKVVPPTQFHTRNFRTLRSSWTPVVDKPSNEQIYKERRELISHWFDLWTDSQRKRYIDILLKQCNRSQLLFMQNWFQERVPLRHLDFTSVLPRFLSTYILSFLDPRNLSRAARVSWHWKFLAEQDVLWMPKCIKLGWHLPYTPSDNEHGAWKRHYIACTMTMDMMVADKAPELYGTPADGRDAVARMKSRAMMEKAMAKQKSDQKEDRRPPKLSPRSRRMMYEARGPWVGPDFHPHDLDKTMHAFLYGFNPNDPQLPKSATVFHNKFGQLKKHARAQTAPAPSQFTEQGLESPKRKQKHRILTSGEDHDLDEVSREKTISQDIEFENYTEKRMCELVHMDWAPPKERAIERRPALSGGMVGYPYIPGRYQDKRSLALSYPWHANPRVVFISSRVPAADVLVDAVMFGVIPIVYEYEGTSVESLMNQLEQALDGRNAQSIGFFCHAVEVGEIRLVHGYTVTLDSLDVPEIREFFEFVSTRIVPASNGGHVDVFLPLASCEPGMEMLVQLNILTGIPFSSPTGIIGNYNHINSEWMLPTDNGQPPPLLYFAQSKLNVWANTADKVQEALDSAKKLLSTYFDEEHHSLVSQVTGQVIFDALGQADIQGINVITNSLVEGLISLGKQKNVKPLEYLGNFLLKKAGGTIQQKHAGSGDAGLTLKLQEQEEDDFDDEDDDYEDEDEENSGDEVDKEVSEITSKKDEDGEEIEEDIVEEIEDAAEKDEKTDAIKEKKLKPKPKRQKPLTKTIQPSQTAEINGNDATFPDNEVKLPRFSRTSTKRLTAKQFTDHPEKRTPIAQEIFASEVEFMRTLDCIRTAFVVPLRRAISSNRAIISAPHLQNIFSEIMTIQEISRTMVEALKNRLTEWSPHQCLGDIFVKFCSNLKPYNNFLNNYPVTLTTIERCKEQYPGFRAFKKRQEKTPGTKMLTLEELFLTPLRRIGEYVTLLSWFQLYTPSNHADRADLEDALDRLKDMDKTIHETKVRLERDKELIAIQKKILYCPSLLEANRFFIKQQDLALLKAPAQSVVPELRIYQHIETLGFFLFNDALVITKRSSQHFPFQRSVEHTYKYEAVVGLLKLRLEDIPDSKFVKNAFRMFTPKRRWILQANSYDTKFNWMTLLHNEIKTTIENT